MSAREIRRRISSGNRSCEQPYGTPFDEGISFRGSVLRRKLARPNENLRREDEKGIRACISRGRAAVYRNGFYDFSIIKWARFECRSTCFKEIRIDGLLVVERIEFCEFLSRLVAMDLWKMRIEFVIVK